MGVLDTMASASVGTKTVTLIMDAALDAKWDELNEKLVKAADSDVDTGSLAVPATTKVINEMEEIREAVEASQVTFEFAPMDWTQRLSLQADHPPRENNVLDQMRGYNVATFIAALIRACCVKVVDHSGDEATDIPDATWDHLLGNAEAKPPIKPTLTHGQVMRLFTTAQNSDHGVSRVPPSARFLLDSQDSGASLAQPSPGTPRRSGSAAGSPRGSRKSSTAKKAAPTPGGSSDS